MQTIKIYYKEWYKDKFPIPINGILKEVDLRYCLAYNQFLTKTTHPYKSANGKSKTRKDFKNTLLKFIIIPRRNTMG